MSTTTKMAVHLLVRAVKWVVLVVLTLVVAAVACNLLVDAATDENAPVEQSLPRPLDESVYADIQLGTTKEELLDRLEPVEPVDGAALERYELRTSLTPASSCVYSERLGQATGELYRLCFDGDVLVDKTIVFPGTVDRP